LNQISQSQRAGALRIVAGLINSYFTDAARLIATLDLAAQHADAAALAHAAHSLSSSSDFIGARKLALMCGELERAGRAGEAQGFDRRIAGIRQEYEAVQLALEAMRSGGARTSGEP
jgi:HPt (histidine-containing phosphotransfer) domain-containing protein